MMFKRRILLVLAATTLTVALAGTASAQPPITGTDVSTFSESFSDEPFVCQDELYEITVSGRELVHFTFFDETGALHFHVQFVQSGHNITLISPCDPQDNCRIYPYSEVGNVELGTGTSFPVNIVSGTGTFADPGITFTVTTVQNKTFTFTGTVAESKQMIGTISGPTHPTSRLQLDKQ